MNLRKVRRAPLFPFFPLFPLAMATVVFTLEALILRKLRRLSHSVDELRPPVPA